MRDRGPTLELLALDDLGVEVRAVVALDLVEHELPVGAHVERVGPAEGEIVEARYDGAHLGLEPAHEAGQRRCVSIEIDERHVEERLDADLGQAEVVVVEAGDVLRVAGRLQVALEIIGPGVERAHDHARIALALEQSVAAVHAHVVERA